MRIAIEINLKTSRKNFGFLTRTFYPIGSNKFIMVYTTGTIMSTGLGGTGTAVSVAESRYRQPLTGRDGLYKVYMKKGSSNMGP